MTEVKGRKGSRGARLQQQITKKREGGLEIATPACEPFFFWHFAKNVIHKDRQNPSACSWIVFFHLRIIWFTTHDSLNLPSSRAWQVGHLPSKKKRHNFRLISWYFRLKEKVLKENIREIRRANFPQNRAPGNSERYWTQWLVKLIFAMCKSRNTS